MNIEYCIVLGLMSYLSTMAPFVANNHVADDEFRFMSGLRLCSPVPPSSGQYNGTKVVVQSRVPNTYPATRLALRPLFRIMFDFYGYFQ